MDCTEMVYSNDYYDFIVELVDRPEVFSIGPCNQRVNDQYVIGFWKREPWPPFEVQYFTYTAIPKMYTLLDMEALEASNITQIQNLPTLSLKGQGVLIGFVDTGIDYENPIFQNSDGTTRITAIWDQTVQEGPAPEGFIYGAEYRMEQINEALRSPNPKEVVPSVDEIGHGTYIASVAAGSRNLENNFSGAAPYAQIAMVKLKGAKQYLRDFFFVRDGAAAFQENDIMTGISYLNKLAFDLNRPLVLCFCMGTNTGSHGGTDSVAQVLNDFLRRRMRAGVVAAGNEANRRHHYYGTILENGNSETVEINVGPNVSGFTLDFWAQAPELFSIEIISPTGERIPRIPNDRGESTEYRFLFENTTVSVDYRISGARNGAQIIFMRFTTPSEGLWTIRVFAEDVIDGVFHMWLPLEDLLDGDVFFLRSNPDTTITVPANASVPMTVGGYDTRDNSIYLDSGRGYTATGLIKPDFVAPAVEVFGAGLRNGFTRMTGTSAAASITAGAAALMLEWGVVRGNDTGISSIEIKNMFIRSADRDPNRLYPNREWGYGRLDLYQTFNNIRSL